MTEPTTEQIRSLVAAAMPGIRSDLEDLVRIPSVSRDGPTLAGTCAQRGGDRDPAR